MVTKCLDRVLSEDNRRAGFSLKEEGDHFVLLLRYGEIAAVFTQNTTIGGLNEAANKLRS